jgi:hypothetical protein
LGKRNRSKRNSTFNYYFKSIELGIYRSSFFRTAHPNSLG